MASNDERKKKFTFAALAVRSVVGAALKHTSHFSKTDGLRSTVVHSQQVSEERLQKSEIIEKQKDCLCQFWNSPTSFTSTLPGIAEFRLMFQS